MVDGIFPDSETFKSSLPYPLFIRNSAALTSPLIALFLMLISIASAAVIPSFSCDSTLAIMAVNSGGLPFGLPDCPFLKTFAPGGVTPFLNGIVNTLSGKVGPTAISRLDARRTTLCYCRMLSFLQSYFFAFIHSGSHFIYFAKW